MGSEPTTAALVLAAGAGRRFCGLTHKLLAPCGSTTVVDAAVASARGAAIGPVVVVSGAIDLDGRWPDVEVVHHLGWTSGMASSLRAGLALLSGRGFDAVVVGLGDQPGVPAEAWTAVAAGPARVEGATVPPIVTACFTAGRRPPVRLSRSVWDLLPEEGEEGARGLMRRRPELVGEVACPGDPADVDTPEDLRRWN